MYYIRLSQVGVVSYGSECPSHGVYARVTEVKHWIQFLAQEAEDTNCNKQIPFQQGNINLRIYHNKNLLSGLLITGGRSPDGDGPQTAEVWLPGGQSCQLPRLPSPGPEYHTQSSLTTCGGWVTPYSCYTFDGEWEQSHSLSKWRSDHVSWQSPAGILLMGGGNVHYSSGYTSTELLSTTTDTTTPGFSLPYETK